MRAAFVRQLGVCVTLVAATLHARTTFGFEQAPLSLDALSMTRDRPLFSPTRQKPAPVNIVAVAPKPQTESLADRTPQYELAGIIAGSDAVTILLRDPKKNELVKVKSGDYVGDWQVLAMTNFSVRLQNGERNFDIRIFSE
jgi:general secretion pathway protein N